MNSEDTVPDTPTSTVQVELLTLIPADQDFDTNARYWGDDMEGHVRKVVAWGVYRGGVAAVAMVPVEARGILVPAVDLPKYETDLPPFTGISVR